MTKLQAFLDTIDITQAGTDEYGDLRWHIQCSAEGNASDSFTPETFTEEAWQGMALETAIMLYDCWKDYFPQLVKETEEDFEAWQLACLEEDAEWYSVRDR